MLVIEPGTRLVCASTVGFSEYTTPLSWSPKVGDRVRIVQHLSDGYDSFYVAPDGRLFPEPSGIFIDGLRRTSVGHGIVREITDDPYFKYVAEKM